MATPPRAALSGLDLPPEILDPTAVDRLRDLNIVRPGFLADIVSTFEEHTRARLQRIERAARERNGEELWRNAHNLKSSCSIVGALRMWNLCTWLEEKGQAGGFGGTEEAIRLLREEFDSALAALRQELRTPPVKQ